MRRPLPILLLLLGLASLAGPAGAQVRSPTLVEEDLPPEEAPRPVPPPSPAPPEPRAAPQAVPESRGPEAVQVRVIEPVRSTWEGLLGAWRDRRRAVREQDAAGAKAAALRLLDAARDLGIDNLSDLAASEVREVGRALAERLPAEAVEHAELAVQLAPDLGDAWLELARARLARDPTELAPVAGALGTAIRAAAREPHTARAFLGDVLAAAMAALALASAATLLLLFLRRSRTVLHDFGHFPVLRAGTRLQAFFLALVLLGLPLALGLGLWAVLAALAIASWFHLGTRERLVATAALAALALLPLAAGGAARLTSWTGSMAEEVFELEHGADGGERAARLERRGDLPAPALAAIGRFHKRRGDLAAAARWYQKAAEAAPPSASLLVNEGNLRFLRGDVDGAKAAWLDASDRAAGDGTALAAASYNLSKLYLRQSALEQSQQARRRAQQLDAELIARHGSDGDFRANRWILDAPVSPEAIGSLAAADGMPGLVKEAVRARLAGRIPAWTWPWGPLGLLLLLWLAVPFTGRLRPSSACERCGRTACVRCDAQSGPLCAQCLHVFTRKELVESRDRARKEEQVRRHAEVERWGTRLLALVAGGAGHVWLGQVVGGALVLLGMAFLAFVVVFWRGLVPPPHPSPYLLLGKLVVAVPLGLLLYGLSVRDAWRRTRD